MSKTYNFHLGSGNNGNVWGITDNLDPLNIANRQIGSATFGYDPLNRLVSAQSTGTDCTVIDVPRNLTKNWGNSYTIDAWGNLTNKTVTKCTSENLNEAVDVTNRLTGPGRYDAAGNMIQNGLYGYDAENRLLSLSGTPTYTYDADGNRVSKPTMLYWAGSSADALMETNASGSTTAEYIFLSGKRVARINPGSPEVAHYYISDHLGSATVIATEAGTTESEEMYYPYGGERWSSGADPNHYKFTGKERDSETGLDYFGARFYGSSMGRFLSPDEFAGGPVDAFGGDPTPPGPLPYADITNPQSLNKYSYTYNNLLRYTDPDGHDIWDTLLGVVNSTASNFAGAQRIEGGNADFKAGQIIGDVASVVAGTVGAVGAAVGDAALDVGTGGAALVAAPAQAAAVAIPASGAINGALSLYRTATSATDTQEAPKPGSEDGPGSGKRATPAQRDQALQENNGNCVFCGKKATEVDHAVPRSRGGDTTRKNLQPTCQTCNRQKGAKTTKEYKKWRKEQQEQRD